MSCCGAARGEPHGDQAGEGGDERDDAHAAGQVAAQPGAEREQRGGGRDVAHRLREQGVRLAAGRRPHLLVGKCTGAHDPAPFWAADHRPGRRVVISWTSQPLPSGSSNETNEP